jgi:hypothetical protein
LLREDAGNRGAHDAFTAFGLHHGRALLGVGRPGEAVPVLQALIDASGAPVSAAGQRRASRARLALAGALQALDRGREAIVVADQARTELEAQLAAEPKDINGWPLLAQAQSRLHALALPAERPAWRLAFEHSVARARGCGALNPVQERNAAWPPG